MHKLQGLGTAVACWVRLTLVLAVLMAVTPRQAEAGLILTINNFTADELSFSISGSFDTNTIGDSAGYLALKNDWSHNGGIHTELFSANPTITLNTITIGGAAPATFVQNGSSAWMDNVFFENPLGSETPILAGTVVSGSFTLTAVGAFNPADAATLELASGFVRPFGPGLGDDWARLEAGTSASEVPEASSLTMAGLGVGLLSIVSVLRRRVR